MSERREPGVWPSGLAAFDERYRGLIPGEVAVLAGTDHAALRDVALQFVAGALSSGPEGQVRWAAMASDWSTIRYDQEVVRLVGQDRARRFEVRRSNPVLATELHTSVRAWATAERGRCIPALVVVETFEAIRGRADSVHLALKPMALKHPMVAVLLLSHLSRPRKGGPRVADYDQVGDAIDFLLWLHDNDGSPRLSVRKARNGQDGLDLDIRSPGPAAPAGPPP